MTVRYRVEVEDLAARARFRALRDKAQDFRPFFLETVDPSMTEFLQDQFQTEGRAGGSPWAPLAPFTVQWKMRAGQGRAGPSKVGQDTRRMWAAFTKPGAPGSVRTIRKRYYERGADAPRTKDGKSIPALFQSGYPSVVFGFPTGRTVPARPIIPERIPGSLRKKWERAMARYLERGGPV